MLRIATARIVHAAPNKTGPSSNGVMTAQETTRLTSSSCSLSLVRPRACRYQMMMDARSEEHTSELQSLAYLVCRLLLEKKKQYNKQQVMAIQKDMLARARPGLETHLGARVPAPAPAVSSGIQGHVDAAERALRDRVCDS